LSINILQLETVFPVFLVTYTYLTEDEFYQNSSSVIFYLDIVFIVKNSYYLLLINCVHCIYFVI